ncbi:MAG: hypothetical protein GY782_12315, partial [Gammaproteobacteria bacterium]|nr:hypothetical protein [Gammaproteobacteria bacterium]
MRPAGLETEPLARGETVRNIMSEQGTSQVNNHSATKGPASSGLHFQYKDKEPLDVKLDVTKKLKLPTAAEKGMWMGIDEDLDIILTNGIEERDDEKRLELTEKMVYNYLEARFGEEERRSPKAAIRPKRMEDKETRTIRLSKREARREKKEAKRSKDQNSIKAAKMEYLKLVRLHNKSRRNQLRKQKKKENKKEQEQFKRNPFEYSKKLLDGKSNNKPPEFSKETADK